MTSLSHLACVAALLVSFALLWAPSCLLCAVQALLAAIALGAHGWSQGTAVPGIAAILGFALNGALLPFVLYRLAPPQASAERRALDPILAAILVALAVVVSTRMAAEARADMLALGLSVLLIGLLVAARQAGNTGLANTGLANTGLANTGAANTGAANTGAANTGAALGILSAHNGMVIIASAIPALSPAAVLPATLPWLPCLAVVALCAREAMHPAAEPP